MGNGGVFKAFWEKQRRLLASCPKGYGDQNLCTPWAYLGICVKYFKIVYKINFKPNLTKVAFRGMSSQGSCPGKDELKLLQPSILVKCACDW